MAEDVSLEYVAVGGNRHPNGSDWDHHGSGLLAFAADNNVALWNPLDPSCRGVRATFIGHTEPINAIRFFTTKSPSSSEDHEILLFSGGIDCTLRLWTFNPNALPTYRLLSTQPHGVAPIIALAACPEAGLLASSAANGTITIWTVDAGSVLGEDPRVVMAQTISPKSRYIAMGLVMIRLEETGSCILAAASTSGTIELYVQHSAEFHHATTLSGHTAWVRSVAFTKEHRDEKHSDWLLASTSQDKSIRLWRLQAGQTFNPQNGKVFDPSTGLSVSTQLSNKAHRFAAGHLKCNVTFEALLFGHEDWILSAQWCPTGKPQLLTASMDSSIAFWERDEQSGIWFCKTRLGQISAQKGATTATGSMGGFYCGLWSPDGHVVTTLGRTGSWRIWSTDAGSEQWEPRVSISGHVKPVMALAWARDGSCLLSTSSDQTTRLFAPWRRNEMISWHEFSRPQIHGYDLNCIDFIDDVRFISGADEKLLRVFEEPKPVATILQRLTGATSARTVLPDAASVAVLGLSNKQIEVEAAEPEVNGGGERDAPVYIDTGIQEAIMELHHPPIEDQLARHMLWPESEKLYGHGYEISAVAASHDGTLVATACKASSIDHAVIRIYETQRWREIKPPLTAHSLTATSLAFSPDDQFLLSTGRDRQWALFERSPDDKTKYTAASSNPKGHARMILDCSWASLQGHTTGNSAKQRYGFATAGRDKNVKIWSLDPSVTKIECSSTIDAGSAVTAVDFLATSLARPSSAERLVSVLAYGTEDGHVTVAILGENLQVLRKVEVSHSLVGIKVVNCLLWRPTVNRAEEAKQTQHARREFQLAVASDDTALRILNVVL